MIATDKFNFIHLPKTGGTFTQKIISDYYLNKTESILGFVKQKLKIEYCHKYYNPNRMLNFKSCWGQHGGINQIPEKYKGKKTLSIIRNPFDWYASLYGFKWWETNPELTENLSFKNIKNYPNISFEEMIDIYHQAVIEFGESINLDLASIGYYTFHFVLYYYSKPIEIFRKIVAMDSYEISEFSKLMYSVRFITQENLNVDLYNFLKEEGFNNIGYILKSKKILPNNKGRAKGVDGWKEFFNKELIEMILEKEKLIFKLFPHYAKNI